MIIPVRQRHPASTNAAPVVALAALLGAAAASAVAQPIGACCTGSNCSLTTQTDCTGQYRGDFTDCAGGTPTVFSAEPNLAIPDAGCPGFVSSTISPAGSPFTVTGVTVHVVINHTYLADLRVRLTHGSTTVTLLANVCDGEADLDVYLDDAGGLIDCWTPTTGTARPSGAGAGQLASFIGHSSAGAWTLQVCDGIFDDEGTLVLWDLVLRREGAQPCAPIGNDCFTRTAAPVNGRHVRGGPNGVGDDTECVGDWDRNGQLLPSDVASFVATWFFGVTSPGNLDADIDCDGSTLPADVAYFVSRWFAAVQAPGTLGCPG